MFFIPLQTIFQLYLQSIAQMGGLQHLPNSIKHTLSKHYLPLQHKLEVLKHGHAFNIPFLTSF